MISRDKRPSDQLIKHNNLQNSVSIMCVFSYIESSRQTSWFGW